MTGWIERPDGWCTAGTKPLVSPPVCQIAQPGLDMLACVKNCPGYPAGSPSPSRPADPGRRL